VGRDGRQEKAIAVFHYEATKDAGEEYTESGMVYTEEEFRELMQERAGRGGRHEESFGLLSGPTGLLFLIHYKDGWHSVGIWNAETGEGAFI